MVKTGQFTTNFGRTPPRTLITPLAA